MALVRSFVSPEEVYPGRVVTYEEVAPLARSLTEASSPRVGLERLFDGYAQLFDESPEICLFLQQTLLDTQNKRCFQKGR